MKRLFNILKDNIWLKLSALFFAVIVWTMVVSLDNPFREKLVSDVPVRYSLAEIEEKDLLLYSDAADVFGNVEVNVNVRFNDINDLSKNNITVTADLSGISAAGEHEVPLKAESTIGQVLQVRPSTIIVEVDNLMKDKPIPVSFEKVGTMPEGLVDGDVEITPAEIKISGPQQDIEKATRARVSINLSDATEDINSSYSVKVYTDDGSQLPDSTFRNVLPSVAVKMEVLHKKTVPIRYSNASLSDLDKIDAGYQVVFVELEPKEVEIKGHEEDLAQIEYIDIKPISVDNINVEDPEPIPVELIMPSDKITLVNPVQVQATVTIEKLPEETPAVTATATGRGNRL